MTTYVISVGIADVFCDPDPTSELVTQALMNAPLNWVRTRVNGHLFA